VHTDSYLESLQEPGALVGILGTDPGDAAQDAYLLSQREQAGGTSLAARLALVRRGLAVNLGGGFHHADAGRGHGFCVFHDVAVAILSLRAHGLSARVLVIDLDLHDGDGTRSLFAADATVHTLSIHNRHLGPVDAIESTSIALGEDVEDGRYLDVIREAIPPLVRTFRPELVFYLAGVDPADDDALGNWRIGARALVERDRIVLEALRAGNPRRPIVLLLAGGYGDRAWRHTARSLGAVATGVAAEPLGPAANALASYRAVARALDDLELASEGKEDGWGLSEEDLDPGQARRRGRRFLGFYSPHGLELALERYGFLDAVRGAHGGAIRVAIDVDGAGLSTLRVHPAAGSAEPLVELRLGREERLVPGLALLAVDWLLLQAPLAPFRPERPPLPGQSHPGLGLLADVVALLVLACERLGLDGVAVVPAHYHVAALAAAEFRFVSPERQARFEALRSCLRPLPLAAAALAVEHGRVWDARGDVVAWEPAPMVRPVRPGIEDSLFGATWRARVDETLGGLRYAVR
jgi:acetoin utilization deacetylase AcuC-like enzyme